MLIRWQPWSSRLQTTIFYIGIVLVGFCFDLFKMKTGLSTILTITVFVLSMPYMFLSTTRPFLPMFPKDSLVRTNKIYRYSANKVDKYLINHPRLDEMIMPIKLNFLTDQSIFLTDRDKQYFFANKVFYEDYYGAVKAVRDIDEDEIGLVMDADDWEYPIWVLLDIHAKAGLPVLNHILRVGEDGFGNRLGSVPNLIISTKEQDLTPFDLSHKLIYDSDFIRVLYRE
jgi:hypothetical protein